MKRIQSKATPALIFVQMLLIATVQFSGQTDIHSGEAQPAAPSPAVTKTPAAKDDIETVDVKDMTKPSRSGSQHPAPRGILAMLDRLHPALVHLPIAWSVMLLLVDVMALILGGAWIRFGMFVIVMTFLSCIPTVITGLLHASEMANGAALSPGTLAHRNLAISATTVLTAAMAVRIWRGNSFEERRSTLAYFILMVASVILFGITGHLGGELVFGEDFMGGS